jgi:hypothetical protein
MNRDDVVRWEIYDHKMGGRQPIGAKTTSLRDARVPERQANAWARRVAGFIFLVGVAVVLIPAAVHAGDLVGRDPFKPRQTSVVTTRIAADGSLSSEKT